MSAQALFAASAGLELISGVSSAYKEQAYAELQSGLMQRQMDEIQGRAVYEQAKIAEQSEKVVAAQTAAFITGGVELSGSAMSVVSDTLNDAAQAAYIAQRELDYDMGSLAIQKKQWDQAADNGNLYLKIAAAGLGSAASFGKNMYAYNKMGGTGKAAGLGTDRAGGTTQYSQNYLNS